MHDRLLPTPKMKLGPEEVKRALDPLLSFHLELEEEMRNYEGMKRGEFGEIVNLQGLGQLLVGLRIAVGLTQRQLAERLSIHESQVSRDERNEYHGISIERANRILEALRVQLRSRFDEPIPRSERQEASG
jgi:DNA-binding XRE family transcriptional regulator